MNRSDPIYNTIALVILTIIFVLFWNFTTGTSDVEGRIASNEVVMDSLSIIYEHFYRMIPIFFTVVLFSLAITFFLEEWIPQQSWQYRIIERIIAILASIPSLVYGILGAYLLVIQSDRISYLTLIVTVVLLVVPVIIQSTQMAIQGVDIPVREAAYALGANRWRVIADHVLPNAFPVILGGIFIAISRVLAIAALIIVVYEWKITQLQSMISFGISKSVVILLSSALISSIFSSFLHKNSDYRTN